jgi:WD40 repeat protein
VIVRRLHAAAACAAAIVVCAGCGIARVPIGAGPPFLRAAGLVRLSDLHAISPPAWSPDGGAVAFSTADAVWIVRPPVPADNAHRLAPLPGVASVAWSPDGRIVVALAGGRIVAIPVDDPSPRPLASMTGVSFLAWAPGGRGRGVLQAAVAASAPSGRTTVWHVTIPTEAGEPAGAVRFRRLGALPRGWEVGALVWMAGDAGVAVAADDTYGDGARVMFLNPGPRPGGRAQTLPAGDHAPVPSPQGRFIAYLEDVPDGGARLCVMRTDGTGRRALSGAGRYSGVAWSPSGTLLAFARQDADRLALGIIDVMTGEALRLGDYRPETGPVGAPVSIAWAPDGTRLAFGTDTGTAPGFVWLAALERQ